MSGSRPTLARKESRATTREVDQELESGLKVTLDGKTYEVRVGDVTSDIARELRAYTGFGFARLCAMLPVEPDVDLIAAFVWVASRVAGERLDFHDVSVSYRQLLGSGFDIDVVDGEADPDPEA